jgi:hypothetical protein
MLSGGGRLLATESVALGGIFNDLLPFVSPYVNTGNVQWVVEGSVGVRL